VWSSSVIRLAAWTWLVSYALSLYTPKVPPPSMARQLDSLRRVMAE